MKKLNKRELAKIDKIVGRHPIGDGLYLSVRTPTLRYWTYRFRVSGRQSETSLGPYPEVPLETALTLHAEKRAQVLNKVDPVGDKRRVVRPAGGTPTFGQVVDRYIESHEHDWKNVKHAQQWRNTTKAGGYLEPIRGLQVDKVTTAAIHDLLEPLWRRAPETAQRLRGRIEMALDFAQARGHIDEDRRNPARWKGRLDKLLPKPPKHVNHVALPYADVPALMQRLRKRGEKDIGARALELAILTAARSGEVFGMTWSEIDFDEKVWTVPEDRMKAGKLHRVPLADRALEILRQQFEERRPHNDHVFPGRRPARPLSSMTLTMLLRRMKIMDEKGEIATAHGFRSSFRDWAGDIAHCPREIAEQALAHAVGGVEGAYRRGDALKKRRELMDAWAAYCSGAPGGTAVIPIAASRA
jgi:integrase